MLLLFCDDFDYDECVDHCVENLRECREDCSLEHENTEMIDDCCNQCKQHNAECLSGCDEKNAEDDSRSPRENAL